MKLILLFLFLPLLSIAHPGIAIVHDSKGVIYYSDLEQVWKIVNGKKTMAVPNVHTHELHIDANDNLYGEELHYEGDRANIFTHFLWVLRPYGKLDTLMTPRQAYIQNDYSLARDLSNNEYFIKLTDSTHIYKRSPGGKEKIFASGNFNKVSWLHPQKNGSLLYTRHNNIYRVDSLGKITIIASKIGNEKPTFSYWRNGATVYGIWEDNEENVYVAIYSDQAIKKIDKKGKIDIIYKSEGRWAPTHGMFDKNNRLWVLECSDRNEIRVVTADKEIQLTPVEEKSYKPMLYFGIVALLLLLLYRVFIVAKVFYTQKKSAIEKVG